MGGVAPVVLAGAHRSGTTLAVRMLDALGLFTGAQRDPNLESYFFLRRNEWLLRQAGGSWDRPQPLRQQLAESSGLEAARAACSQQVRSLRFAGYAGKRSMLLRRGTRGERGPWGWKDPRNTFTFEAWAGVFGGARLVVFERNGVDVAESLCRRQREVQASGVAAPSPSASALLRLDEPLEPYVVHSERCGTWEGAFALWEEYAAAGRALFDRYDGPKLRVRFEELVAKPLEQLRLLAEFCGLSPTEAALQQACAEVEPARGSSFCRDPELSARYEAVRETPVMQQLGYDTAAPSPAADGGVQ